MIGIIGAMDEEVALLKEEMKIEEVIGYAKEPCVSNGTHGSFYERNKQ